MHKRAAIVLGGFAWGIVSLLAANAGLDRTALLQLGILCLTLLELHLLLREQRSFRRAAVFPVVAAVLLTAVFLRGSLGWFLPVPLLVVLWALERRRPTPRRFLLLALAIPAAGALTVFYSPVPKDLTACILAAHLALAAGGFVLAPEKEVPGTAKGSFLLPLCSMFWLGFHLLGVAMTVMKCYPVPAFLPFMFGAGTALYAILTQSESASGRTQTVLFALFGVILLGDRIVQLFS